MKISPSILWTRWSQITLPFFSQVLWNSMGSGFSCAPANSLVSFSQGICNKEKGPQAQRGSICLNLPTLGKFSVRKIQKAPLTFPCQRICCIPKGKHPEMPSAPCIDCLLHRQIFQLVKFICAWSKRGHYWLLFAHVSSNQTGSSI